MPRPADIDATHDLLKAENYIADRSLEDNERTIASVLERRPYLPRGRKEDSGTGVEPA